MTSHGKVVHTAYLVIFWGKLIQTFLNNVIAIQILDENNDMTA